LGCAVGLSILGALFPAAGSAQTVQTPQEMRNLQTSLGGRNCPGDPAGNLASFDCSFTARMRALDFVGTSVTDQALLGATFFGSFAYFTHRDPSEWGRGWGSFGRSIGTRYVQNLSKGTATYAVGMALGADPRNLSLLNDPGFPHDEPSSKRARVGHAVFDWVSVRRSSRDGNGRRLPNLPLWTGAAVSGLVGNAFQPSGKATTESAIVTATSSLATALAFSFYTEFSPELGRVLGGLVKRGRMSSSDITANGRTR
jgi:hypothetical protein